jgi:hypothetical protein
MDRYGDLLRFARNCMRHARTATTARVAEQLTRLASEYQGKAAELNGGELPKIDDDRRESWIPGKRCADPTFRIDSGSVSLRFGLDR